MKTREFILAEFSEDYNDQRISEIEGYDNIPYSGNRPSTAFVKFPDSFREWLLDTLESIRETHPKLYAYENKAYQKWFGPQGHTIDKVTLLPKVMNYFNNTTFDLKHANLLPGLALVRYWMRKLKLVIPEKQTYNITEIYHKMLSWDKAGGGYYYNGDKRKYRSDIISSAMRHYKRFGYFRVHPIIAGYRHSKQKIRAIFKDDPRNWVAYQYYYGYAIDYLRVLPIFSWSGIKADALNAYTYSSWQNAFTICCDYESMDNYFTLDHAILVDEFLTRLRLISRDQQQERQDWLRNLFQQPILIGSDVLTGLHSLLSGINPTNDFETLISLIAQAHMLERLLPECRLTDYFPTFVGDDSRIRLKSDVMSSFVSLKSIAEFLTEYYGLVANPIKQEITQSDYVYCKHLFPANPSATGRVYYPAVLVLNSILYPEYGDVKDPYGNFIRILSIVDHLEYHPLRAHFLNYLLKVIDETGYRDIIEFAVSQPDTLVLRHGYLARTYSKPVQLSKTWMFKYILQYTRKLS